jgi:hypothetical protein
MMPLRLCSYNLAAGLVLAAACLAATQAVAALGDVGFQVKITEKEMILAHPGEMGYKMFAAWDAPYQRIAARNMPFVEVMNLSESTGNLTEFSMTIGDTDFNFSSDYFGDYAIQSNSTPDPLISSITSNGDLLTLTFGDGGLAPGEIIRFGIDLDPDAGLEDMFPHPDFRLVLFDMNDMDGNGVSDNSVVSAVFTDPNNVSMTATASTVLEDYTVTGPQANYFNQIIRPYSVMEGVDIFSESVFNGGTEIPEPGAASLAALGVLGLGLWQKRRSRRLPGHPTA